MELSIVATMAAEIDYGSFGLTVFVAESGDIIISGDKLTGW